jgi:two-component system, LytTR family, sensor histidine kinase AlgZ
VQHPLISEPRRLSAYLLIWLVPTALLLAVPLATYPPGWRSILLVMLPMAALYAFVCLAAWYPCQANPPGTPLGRLLAVHLAGAALATGAWVLVGQGWSSLVARWHPGATEAFSRMVPLFAIAGFLLYLLAAAACTLHLASEAAHGAERRALEAQVATREAELRALRAQMDPHFLFNALNSVSALVGGDPPGARRMLEQLAGFLRGSLELDRSERIPLAKELALAHAFLQIERVRFGERLKFVSEVDEAAASVEVPPLLLQPLVENALKHGIAHLLDGGTVSVQAKRRSDTLYIVVENPLDPDRPASPGVALGLENVRRRLRTTYGERALVVVDSKRDRFRVELRIPLGPPPPVVAPAPAAEPAATPSAAPARLPEPSP